MQFIGKSTGFNNDSVLFLHFLKIYFIIPDANLYVFDALYFTGQILRSKNGVLEFKFQF